MILKHFVLGPIENNNYLLIDEESKEAVLFDCTEENEKIDAVLKEYNANLKYILLTHGHFDHILGINAFKENHPDCKVLIHENDKELMDKVEEYSAKFGLPNAQIQQVDGFLKDGDIISFGSKKIKVIYTPGHTQGGVCYLIDDLIFTGDTLFYESVGRTDLPGGDFGQLKSHIVNKLFTLDEKIKVYPGHGISSTIGHEKENNKFM